MGDGFRLAHDRIDSRAALLRFLRAWNYEVEETPWDIADLPERARELAKTFTLLSHYPDGGSPFQVFLIELRTAPGGHIHRSDLRTILDPFYRRFPQGEYLFIFTADYSEVEFVSPKRLLTVGKAETRLQLRILTVDPAQLYHTDQVVLGQIALSPGERDAGIIWQRHESAFDIEQVTGHFFDEYGKHFKALRQALRRANPHLRAFADEKCLEAFAQRLLGRVMFLYFLQKKGWLNGDRQFVRHLFEQALARGGDCFYKDFLEPLFFNVLNSPRPGNQSAFGVIPFLNGGLFEPDEEFVAGPPDAIFGGLLDFFDHYNFTVREDTPLEVEVALDPELLGLLFENMLAERERKTKGTFYTPRPIVHYICRESLKEYLADRGVERDQVLVLVERERTDSLDEGEAAQLYQALREVRVVDPAVGSGAFLVGMMQELIRLRRALGARLGRVEDEGRLKREIIEQNLYGVDIEAEAIEVARLRLWLSLVVDEELEHLEPLPNLDYKLIPGNSLIEIQDLAEGADPAKPTLMPSGWQARIAQLERLKEELTHLTDPQAKKRQRQATAALEREIFESIIDEQAEAAFRRATAQARVGRSNKQALAQHERFQRLKEGPVPFAFRLHFAEVFSHGGFDIVIANPPYVRTQNLSDLPYREELERHYGFIEDLYVHFTLRAFELARIGGIVTFITSDTYFTLITKEPMRRLLQKKRLLRLVPTPRAFKATVDTAIFIARNHEIEDYSFVFLDASDLTCFLAPGDPTNRQLELFETLVESRSYDSKHVACYSHREMDVWFNRDDPLLQYNVPIAVYKNAVNGVFFTPTRLNVDLYNRFMQQLRSLHGLWWDRVRSSKAMQKYRSEVESYLRRLQPGDITLLGLITEGGQGLATADNGRFLALVEGTKEAGQVREQRQALMARWKKDTAVWRECERLLGQGQSMEQAFDALRGKFGDERLGLRRGFLYKVISLVQVFDPAGHLEAIADPRGREAERRRIVFEGLEGERCWVPFETTRSAEDLYYWSPNAVCIDWSRESVRWYFENSGKREANMPVMRNPEMYLRPGLTFSRFTRLRAKIVEGGVFDDSHPVLTSIGEIWSSTFVEFLMAILNSAVLATVFDTFFLTHKLELNSLRLLPVVIPTLAEQETLARLVQQAVAIQKRRFANPDAAEQKRFERELATVQEQVDNVVAALYGVDLCRGTQK